MYAYNLFNNKNNGIKFISNSYTKQQYYLISNIAYFTQYRKLELLSSYDYERVNYFKSKQEMNLEKLGNNIFNFFRDVCNEITSSNQEEIKFESTIMVDKYDNADNPFYELSVTVKGRKTILFYYSSIEARDQEQLKDLIGEFISLFKGGEKHDWKPAESIQIDGETPYN